MSGSKQRELVIPTAASTDENALEVARVWVAAGGQHVSLATEVWNDPAAWGIRLADLARHVANAYSQTHDLDRNETLDRIRAGFEAEWSNATDTPNGKVG